MEFPTDSSIATAGPGETAWDNAPDAVVLPLLQNTMLTSLKAAVPSQSLLILKIHYDLNLALHKSNKRRRK